MRPKLKITSSTYTREDILEWIDEAHLQKNRTAKRRLQVILHAFSGMYTTDEIAEVVGCSRASVTNWVRRWRAGGFFALAKNHYKPTRIPALTDEMIVDLIEHRAFGLISGGKGNEATQVWLKERYDVDLSITAVDYWSDRIIHSVFEKGEYEIPKHPPENPHEVDLNQRRRKEEREKRKEEGMRRSPPRPVVITYPRY
jgi:transposase